MRLNCDLADRDYRQWKRPALLRGGGRFGSLHEFTSALEAHKPCGVLLGSGGTADSIPELIAMLDPHMAEFVVYDTDPVKLVKKIIAIIDKEYEDIRKQIQKDEHWYLGRDVMDNPPPRAG